MFGVAFSFTAPVSLVRKKLREREKIEGDSMQLYLQGLAYWNERERERKGERERKRDRERDLKKRKNREHRDEENIVNN